MDNPWIHCINKLLGWLLHWMADDPWIIHGYIVFPNYWGGYYIGCQIIHGYVIHGYIVLINYWGG